MVGSIEKSFLSAVRIKFPGLPAKGLAMTLPRRYGTVRSSLGEIRVKEVETPSGKRLYPEYEECRKVASDTGKSLQEIYREVYKCSVDDFRPEGE